MKVAGIIAGQPRFCREFDFFCKNIVGADQIDWFVYLWRNNIVDGDTSLMLPEWSDTLDYQSTLSKIEKGLPAGHRLVVLKLDDMENFPHISPHNRSVTDFRLWMHYTSLHQSDLLRQEYEKTHGEYDLVIRARPDAGVKGTPLDLREVNDVISRDPNTIVTDSNIGHGHNGYQINSSFAVSSSNGMRLYTDSVNHFNEFISKGLTPHSETLLAYQIISNGYKIKQGNFFIDVVRAGRT
jgi:hypothetical protein